MEHYRYINEVLEEIKQANEPVANSSIRRQIMKNVEVENSRMKPASNSMISALAADPDEQESQPPVMGQRRMSLRTSLGWDQQKAATLEQNDDADEKGEEEEEYDEEEG